ncbi:hypothetical protein [Aliiroseovarius marinus]|uniref:hypothetical protein n=1 Tax=Aliiroseovarius marinus TaxID=2500159 RepID=UPI003D7EDDC5
MIGIVLWYSAKKRIGLVWCEDQGPLAYIGPSVQISGDLERGAQVSVQYDESDGFRTVRHLVETDIPRSDLDPQDILTGFDQQQAGKSPAYLSIVA